MAIMSIDSTVSGASLCFSEIRLPVTVTSFRLISFDFNFMLTTELDSGTLISCGSKPIKDTTRI